MNTRIRQLFATGNLSPSAHAAAAGLPNSALTEWGKGKARPSIDALIKISKYFGVSLDWIVYGDECTKYKQFPFSDPSWMPTKITSAPAPTPSNFSDMFDSLSDFDKGRVLSYMDGLSRKTTPTVISDAKTEPKKRISL